LETRHRALFLLAIAVATAACKGQHDRVTVQNEEEPEPRMASLVRMNDPKASAQMLSGFYGLEDNTWRWTSGKFAVQLRTPPAAQSGAILAFSFTIPDVIVQKLGKIRITASIGGMELKSAEYGTPGSYVFSADVPASLLTAESVKVDFFLNKTMRPDGDARVLGVVANSVSIAPR